MGEIPAVSGPDFGLGVALADIPDDGVLAGHVEGTPVLLARLADGLHAVSGSCSHYGAPLSEGLRVGEEIRCPWHHACFSLRSGQALKAPAFASLDRWQVQTVAGRVFVREHAPAPAAGPAFSAADRKPRRIVLVGGGAAAFAAAERLRALGFDGALDLLSADDSPPCDRPNLSKDYLAGTAPEDWIPLRPPSFYAERDIRLHLDCEVAALDPARRRVSTRAGRDFAYDALLLAPGAEPRRLPLPGFDRPEVHVLRSLADARALIAAASGARRIALVGAGFIGLEAAAALRTRGLGVHVIAPETLPLAGLLGEDLARHLLDLHGQQGVTFHLDCRPTGFDGRWLGLSDGRRLEVDLVLLGVGVNPRTALAQAAGLAVDDGILVDARLRTSAAGVFAAGDVARYPHAGGTARVEHWVHAQRQGQVAAANMLGGEQAFDDPPFFWTHHYGTDLRYLGHGKGWTEAVMDGSPASDRCLVRYLRDGRLLAAAAIGRDRELLAIEAELRRPA
ncbi:FAD-dependent oxidoreductase [Arenimonas fontis]|uniref:Rieske 2Fe-2S domain-containing protein n=1 Tax=Arenimonas fontis TaxID=2608255 RepID=A0A5B2Z7W7_9GAMM|nr:FAD-dependent oxidoreductase [Arenimonas fontis]KAA2284059.1 Rieske 2Fe-2S domain-containing protein [Arenimonas fontis]